MSLSELIREFLPAIEESLKSSVKSRSLDSYPELRQMIAYHMGWEGEGAGLQAQGKRIRPLLLTLCTATLTDEWRRSLPAAAAVELLHNFSLVHDDIQDQSPLRRGRPTVWVKWGTAQAINVGDALFSLSQLTLTNLADECPPQTTIEALILLNQTCVRLTGGQYLDMSYEQRSDLTRDDYWPMISGKTAALISACTKMGALIGGASLELQEDFSAFGQNLGLAFQVQDDWLGIWGDEIITGKSTDSDLVTGKKSFPVLFGLDQKGEFARRWLTGPVAPSEAEAMADLLVKEGAKDFTSQVVDQLTQRALEAHARIDQSNPASRALIELAQKLLSRQA